MLPYPYKPEHRSKFGVAIYGLLFNKLQNPDLSKLVNLVKDLVSVKLVGAIFLTDVELEKADVYAQWSSFWAEFIDAVSQSIDKK